MTPEPTIVEHFIVARDRNDSQARLDLKGFAKNKRSSLVLLQLKQGGEKSFYDPMDCFGLANHFQFF